MAKIEEADEINSELEMNILDELEKALSIIDKKQFLQLKDNLYENENNKSPGVVDKVDQSLVNSSSSLQQPIIFELNKNAA